ncbi:MAG: response regulator transcription factor [Pseudomonadota bacterium]
MAAEVKEHGVVLVEDDPATLDALSAQIKEMPGFRLQAAAGSYADGARAIVSPYDLLLVDLDLGDGCGIDLIRASRQQQPAARVLVISVLGDERTVVSAVEAGADGYVLKDLSGETLASQLTAVMDGDAPISPGIARHLLKRFRSEDPAVKAARGGSGALSPRELQMLECLAQGLSYKEVARRFDLSVHTVGDYVKTLYRKLRVRSRGEAVNVALQHGLLELDGPGTT